MCLQLEYCLFGCPGCGLQRQLVRTQLASLEHAGFSVGLLHKVDRGGGVFWAPVYLIICLGGEEEMRRKPLIPKMEEVAKLVVGFGCEGEESSQNAECS